MIAAACNGFPMPTSGETNPPKQNETAPSKADALPEYCRPLSIASVVDDVKHNPNEKRMPSIKIS